MSKSTPINQLRQDDNSEVVQNILNEMDTNPQMQSSQPMPQGGKQPRYQQEYEPEDDYDEQDQYYMPQKELSLTEKIISELKGPLLVAVLVFVINLNLFDDLLVKYVPKIAGIDGGVGMIGLLIKAVIAGALFYVIKKFLL